jgi:hypothetical protein
VLQTLDTALRAPSFDVLYGRLGLRYTVDPHGDLGGFPDHAFDLVFSVDVLEHVPAERARGVQGDLSRILNPGGFSIHEFGIDDPLAVYDHRRSEKEYLRFSDATWRRRFENTVQYFNRVQMSDWLASFESAGFLARQRRIESCDISGLDIDPQFARYPLADLACTRLICVHQKPN